MGEGALRSPGIVVFFFISEKTLICRSSPPTIVSVLGMFVNAIRPTQRFGCKSTIFFWAGSGLQFLVYLCMYPVFFVVFVCCDRQVTGIYFESKVDYTTWFGGKVEYIHGIQVRHDDTPSRRRKYALGAVYSVIIWLVGWLVDLLIC